jgi:hypothetical protein
VLKKLGLSQGSNHATVCKMICNVDRDGDGVDFGEFKCMIEGTPSGALETYPLFE